MTAASPPAALPDSPLVDALVRLGRWLQDAGYGFITPTPATHATVNARADVRQARDLRDVFGWSRPFASGLVDPEIERLMKAAGLLEAHGDLQLSMVRFSSLGERLYAHSAYPTLAADAVFFGPDTYRFAGLIDNELALRPLPDGARILDMCCGAGPGGIEAALAAEAAAPGLTLADVNPIALEHARANAQLAGLKDTRFAQGDLFQAVQGEFDLIVANPPYLVDAAARAYRHGGGELGGGLSERIVADALGRLAPGGRLILYTGSAIVDGRDAFLQAVQGLLAGGWAFRYRELDPDVFAEELLTPAYAEAERIAVVALVVQRPGASPARK